MTGVIRRATTEDLPAIVRMGLRFADAEYRGFLPATASALSALAAAVLANPDALLLVSEQGGDVVGMLAATTYVQPMSGETIATEIAWWMEPQARGSRAALRLLASAETWAKDKGATKFQMIAPTDHVGQFYERLGFTRIETHYQRSLS